MTTTVTRTTAFPRALSPGPAERLPTVNNNEWSTAAEWYNKIMGPATLKACRKTVEAATELHKITNKSHILDVGAGTGSIERVLGQLYPDGAFPVRAIDLAPGMVKQLRDKNFPNVTAEVGDATALDKTFVPDGAFTHAFGSLMVQFCGEKQSLVPKELFRALEPGGVGALSIGHGYTLTDPWDRACRLLDPYYEPIEAYDETSWKTVEPLVAAMKEAGFVDITTHDVWITPSDHAEWASFWMDGRHPVISKQKKAWKGDPEVVRPVMEKVMREQFQDPLSIGICVGIVVGRKPISRNW